MARGLLAHRVEAVRRFNRFYTRTIGVLREGAYQSPFSLTEVRVLYELAHRARPTATELGRALGLDAGYLSRLLRGFARRGFLTKTRSAADGRQSDLALTRRGREVFAPLNTRSHQEVAAVLRDLTVRQRGQLVAAMRAIERLLGGIAEPVGTVRLRAPQPGELGWVIHRHGALYAHAYGYTEQFEALVAGIVARFVEHYDPKRERCWIAEQRGEPVGCVLLVARTKTVAQLRLLLVEPTARGAGIGTRLVRECVAFARQVGYRKLTLWTQSELRAARRLYQAAGFNVVHTERHTSFGKALVSETWQLAL
ncbi:MAG TPA: bifunctional helix-turn-helix transcriptional regulator/GNAT family N-acetyltransferase [Gemmatimonadales bacterium]|nr:bifunctional helix-turn-helix transcriptional regulator/GNAT family N-acetyltransferase [Gemmatimonadales bacterium]